MNRADFTPNQVQVGYDHLRTSMVEGLANLPAGAGRRSFMAGAFCALVTIIWNTREPDVSAIQVQTVLARTLTDVVRQCEAEEAGEYQTQDNPVEALLQAFRAAAICISPLYDQGAVKGGKDAVLKALTKYAEQLGGGPEIFFNLRVDDWLEARCLTGRAADGKSELLDTLYIDFTARNVGTKRELRSALQQRGIEITPSPIGTAKESRGPIQIKLKACGAKA